MRIVSLITFMFPRGMSQQPGWTLHGALPVERRELPGDGERVETSTTAYHAADRGETGPLPGRFRPRRPSIPDFGAFTGTENE